MPLFPYAVSVDFRDHQRHVRIHPEGRRIVDHDGAGLYRRWREFSGCAAARRKQRDVDAFERALGELFDHDRLAAEVDGLAGRTRARQRLQFPNRKSAPVHGGDEFGAHRAGHAGDGDNGIVLHVGHSALVEHEPESGYRFCLATNAKRLRGGHAAGNKKAPDLFRRGFGTDDSIVRLRAHASRGPRGRFGFSGAFGGRDHGAELMRQPPASVNGF
jgi:hypothetical protein